MSRVRLGARRVWWAPCGRFARGTTAFTLVMAMPLMLAPDGDMGLSAEVWRMLATFAIGASATALVIGRKAVIKDDLTALAQTEKEEREKIRSELVDLIQYHSPWNLASEKLLYRLDKMEQRLETVSARAHDAINAAQTAVGVKELVMLALKRTEGEDT